MSELKEIWEPEDRQHGRSRSNPSLFGPILLIAVGVYFLLRNIGALENPTLHWELMWRLWPLMLIFAGGNILVRQFPRPVGSLLSGVVSLAAVFVFGGVLLFGDQMPFVNQLGKGDVAELKVDHVEFTGDGVSTADVTINFGIASASVFALEDSGKVLDGSVSYLGDLSFETEQKGENATVSLDTKD
ncbi:MAG: LiaI-LiaF-like domain-containing protein, partial [Anaerolineae bacterium]